MITDSGTEYDSSDTDGLMSTGLPFQIRMNAEPITQRYMREQALKNSTNLNGEDGESFRTKQNKKRKLQDLINWSNTS